MKKIIAMILAASMLLCGCSAGQSAVMEEKTPASAVQTEAPAQEAAPTQAPETEPATEPTTAPTEPPKVYFNPLNGEILDANGLTAYLPTHVLFLISTILIPLTFLPLFFAAREKKERK